MDNIMARRIMIGPERPFKSRGRKGVLSVVCV